MLCGRQLAERNSEMVRIVEGVQQITVKRMDIIQSRECLEDRSDLFRNRLLGELDFSGVEAPDTADLEATSDPVLEKLVPRCDTHNEKLGLIEGNALCRQSSLRAGQHNIEELRRRRNRGDILPARSRLHGGQKSVW